MRLGAQCSENIVPLANDRHTSLADIPDMHTCTVDRGTGFAVAPVVPASRMRTVVQAACGLDYVLTPYTERGAVVHRMA